LAAIKNHSSQTHSSFDFTNLTRSTTALAKIVGDIIPPSYEDGHSLTVFNAAAASYGLNVGVVWWSIGMAIALGYFIYLYRLFKGKVTLEGEGH